MPVDDLLEGIRRVDVSKMDVEGAELHAFTGLARTLAASPGSRSCSSGRRRRSEAVGDKAEALVDLLEGHGLQLPAPRGRTSPRSSAPSSSTCPTGTSSPRADDHRTPRWSSSRTAPGPGWPTCLASALPQAVRGRRGRQRLARPRGDGRGRAAGRKRGRAPPPTSGSPGASPRPAPRPGRRRRRCSTTTPWPGPGGSDAARPRVQRPDRGGRHPEGASSTALFAEVVLDDEPWFAPGDARPLGRQLRSVTVGGVEVFEDVARCAACYDVEHGRRRRRRRSRGAGRRDAALLRAARVARPGLGRATVTVNGERVPVASDVPAGQPRRLLPRASRRGRRIRPRRPRRRPLRPPRRALRVQRHRPGVPGRDRSAVSVASRPSSSPTTRTPTGACGPGWPACASSTTRPPSVRHRLSATSRGRRVAPGPLPGPAQRPAVPGAQRPGRRGPAHHVAPAARGPRARAPRRCLAKLLPWALASRVRMRRAGTTTPAAVWDRWAGRRHDVGRQPAAPPLIGRRGPFRCTA